MIILLYTIIMVIFFLINKKLYKKTWNYLNVFMAMYYLIILASSFGFYDFTVPTNKTYLYIGIALFSLETFSIIFMKIKFPIHKIEKQEILKYKRLLILALIIFIAMIPRTIEGLKLFKDNGFTAIRYMALTENLDSSNTVTKLVSSYILSPLNKVVLIYAFLEYIRNKKAKIPLIISIVNIFQTVLSSGGRGVLLDLILILAICIFEKYNKDIINIFRKNKKIIIAIMLIAVGIIAITKDRTLKKGEGLLYNMYSYFVGSVHLFDIHVNNPNISLLDDKHMLYGKAIISPIQDITKCALNLFGINSNIKTGVELVNEQIQQFILVNGKVKMNNNVTFVYVCLRDFGFYGLIIDTAYMALWFVTLYKFYLKKKSIRTDALYFYLIAHLPYFIFEYYLTLTSAILTIIYIICFYRFLYKRN